MSIATESQLSPFATLYRISDAIPPLVEGERLTAAEFLRRSDNMPNVKKSELIGGVVQMNAAAVSARDHGTPLGRFMGWLCHYEADTPGVEFGDNSTTWLDDENLPQPDAYLRILESCGGQSCLRDDGYVSGAPELAAEISASSAPSDLGKKLSLYERFGVQEYIVWQVRKQRIAWHVREQGRFVPLPPPADGIYRSRTFPGLWLDVPAMLAGRTKQVFATLDLGVQTAEHGAFVRKCGETET